jgi:HEAT repeats
MSECQALRETLPLLLTESLDPARRELTHQHIETCEACSGEWTAYRDAWRMMEDLPAVVPPARAKARFLASIGQTETVETAKPDNVVPFRKKAAFKWVAQAAAVAVLVGGGYFAGVKQPVEVRSQPTEITSMKPISVAATQLAIAETRVLDANAIAPEIEGRPEITNVRFVDSDASDDDIGVEFDIRSRWTVTGNPRDKSMVRLLSYMLENEETMTPRSTTIDWVRRTYSDPANADPEIANALAKVLRSDGNEGVRLRAVETLTGLPPAVATQTRDALIEALKSDPNPAVRLKAVEALANMAQSGVHLDPSMVDTLRQKASQDDENLYVRVKAAEALSSIKPVH